MKDLRQKLKNLNIDKTFSKILARKYKIKLSTTSQVISDQNVKIQSLFLGRGKQNTADSENSILKSSVQDNLKIFQMFDIN